MDTLFFLSGPIDFYSGQVEKTNGQQNDNQNKGTSLCAALTAAANLRSKANGTRGLRSASATARDIGKT